MRCLRCQQLSPDDAAFCANCGAPLTVGSAEQAGLGGASDVTVAAEATMVANRDRSWQAIVGFVIGVLGLAAWLIPVAGLVFGMLAMICGTIAFHSRRRVLARSGVVLSVVVLAASLFMWVHSAERLSGTSDASAARSGSLQPVVTPCYAAKVSGGLRLSAGSNSCSFQGSDPLTGEAMAVKVLDVPGLEAADLSSVAQTDAAGVIKSLPGAVLADSRSALFAGCPAYQAVVTAADGSGGMIDYVYKPTSQGNLLVLTHAQVHLNRSNYDFGLLEADWSWQ